MLSHHPKGYQGTGSCHSALMPLIMPELQELLLVSVYVRLIGEETDQSTIKKSVLGDVCLYIAHVSVRPGSSRCLSETFLRWVVCVRVCASR